MSTKIQKYQEKSQAKPLFILIIIKYLCAKFRLMNNCFFILLLSATAFLLIGCKERRSKAIDIAYKLTTTAPDSALKVLNSVKQSRLCDAEIARFSLVYTIAQDKKGTDVDKDSLLMAAYTYYNKKADDSLYARCEYYMGKYFMLNDSTEQAIDCLQKSADAAEKQGDKHTQCLALEKLSKVTSHSNPKKAVALARKAERVCSSIPQKAYVNLIYSKLNVSEALLMADSIQPAEAKCKEALNMALASKNLSTISDIYQDISSILSEKGDFKKALWYSRKSYEFDKNANESKLLNLAWAYLDVDSFKQVNKLLDNLKTTSSSKLYTSFYIRHISAIKSHDNDKAIQYADSSYHYIEKMYSDELSAKEKYYTSLVKAKHDNGINKGRAQLMTWLIIVIVITATVIVLFVLYSYRQYKIKAILKLQSEHREREVEKKLAVEELKHREIQLSTMRNYILKKVSIVQKIEELKGNKNKKILLSSKDWEEIQMFVNSVEGGFATRLKKKFPELTEEDLKFFMLLRLGMSSKAMGMIYGISEKSIRQKRFVYKSKVGLDSRQGISLRYFIEAF